MQTSRIKYVLMVLVPVLFFLLYQTPGFSYQPLLNPARSIEHIKGDVYYFKNHIHNTIFMVTPEGIVLVDPLNVPAAKWLKEKLAEQFDQPVKYIIYSHYHGDHASGAEVFKDTVTDIYAHENTPENIRNDPELDQVKVMPTKTYSDSLTLSLGGKSVELIHLDEPVHSDDMTVVRFTEEGILFVVDTIVPNRVLWGYLGGETLEESGDVDGLFRQLDNVEKLDYDILALGHFGLGKEGDMDKMTKYLNTLRQRVSEEMNAGANLKQIKERVVMAEYSQHIFYKEYFEKNIEAMHFWLSKKNGGD